MTYHDDNPLGRLPLHQPRGEPTGTLAERFRWGSQEAARRKEEAREQQEREQR